MGSCICNEKNNCKYDICCPKIDKNAFKDKTKNNFPLTNNITIDKLTIAETNQKHTILTIIKKIQHDGTNIDNTIKSRNITNTITQHNDSEIKNLIETKSKLPQSSIRTIEPDDKSMISTFKNLEKIKLSQYDNRR